MSNYNWLQRRFFLSFFSNLFACTINTSNTILQVIYLFVYEFIFYIKSIINLILKHFFRLAFTVELINKMYLF